MIFGDDSDTENNAEKSDDEGTTAKVALETNWTIPATSRLLEFVEERKLRILETGSQESILKLRYGDWHPIAKRLQSEGFMYSGSSCQKKFTNMKKSYYNNRRIVAARRAMAAKAKRPHKGPIRLVWPFFFRFGALLDETADPDVVVVDREAGKGRSKRSHGDLEDSEDYDDDDDDDVDDTDVSLSKSKRRNSKAQHRNQVSNVIHTLLKSEPVIILDDDTEEAEAEDPENSYSLQLVAESPVEITDIKTEPMEEDQDETELMQRLQRRKLQVVLPRVTPGDLLPVKRSRKSRNSPESTSVQQSDKVQSKTTLSNVKTFSLSSTSSDEVINEIRHLRSDVSRMNGNLEDLVTSHNHLIDNFEKLYKLMMKKLK